MINLIRHILVNNSNLSSVVPASKMTTEFRVQAESTPAIVIDWISTNELYANISDCKHYIYTYDILIYTKGLQDNATIMGLVADAVDRYKGVVTTAAGNEYTVSNVQIINRTAQVLTGHDMTEGIITIEVSA